MASTTISELVQSRWRDVPSSIRNIYLDPSFDDHLLKIATYYNLGDSGHNTLKNEVLFVLFLFEPLSQLKNSLSTRLNIKNETAEAIVFELESSLFFVSLSFLKEVGEDSDFIGFRDHLAPYTTNKEAREKLELRPENVQDEIKQNQQPLTREEVFRAISPTRTLAGDVATLKQTDENKTIGYIG